jgi:hypothetical protein
MEIRSGSGSIRIATCRAVNTNHAAAHSKMKVNPIAIRITHFRGAEDFQRRS